MNFKMNLSLNFLRFNYLVEYGFSILLLNIIIYLILLMLLFSLFFLFNLNSIRTLSELKNFSLLNYIYLSGFFLLLSLAGMPPLLGFLGKFLLIIFFLLKCQYLFFFLFSFVNLFMIYFYIQNLRFMAKKSKVILNIKTNLKIINKVTYLVFFNFLNVCSIFFFNDFLLYLSNTSLFMYIN